MSRVQPSRQVVSGTPGLYRTQRVSGDVYEFRVGKRWVRVPGNPTVTEAKRWRNQFLGTDKRERIMSSRSTFAEVAEVVFDGYRRRRSTLEGHERALRTWLAPLADIRVQEIDKHVLVHKVIRPMEAAERSGSTIHNVLMTASVVFEGAIDARPKLINENPVRRLKPETDKPARGGKREYTTLNAEQFAKLLEASRPPLRALFAVLGLAGLRISEALGLTWDEVLFDSGKLDLTQQLARTNDGKRVDLKTARSRALVPMSPNLSQILAQHSLDQTYYTGEDYVFLNSNGKPFAQRNVQRSLKEACERANIPCITPHELRHSCGSAMLFATGDPARCAKQLRQSLAVFLETYAHEWQLIEDGAVSGNAIDSSIGSSLYPLPAGE